MGAATSFLLVFLLFFCFGLFLGGLTYHIMKRRHRVFFYVASLLALIVIADSGITAIGSLFDKNLSWRESLVSLVLHGYLAATVVIGWFAGLSAREG